MISERDLREPEQLTKRELEVLKHMADGLSNKLIGVQLGISDRTVKFHVENVIRKVGGDTRTGAAVAAIRKGLIT